MTPVVEGEIDLDALDPPRGTFALRCADGAMLTGRFTARRSAAVARFETRREADIELARREAADRQVRLADRNP